MTDSVTSADNIAAKMLIEALHTEFCAKIDDQDNASLGELFTEGAVFAFPDQAVVGRDKIVEFYCNAGRDTAIKHIHFWSNLRIKRLAPGRFETRINALAIVAPPRDSEHPARLAASAVTDVIVIDGDVALFERRELKRVYNATLTPFG